MNELRKVKITADFGKEKDGYFHQWGTKKHPVDNGTDILITVAIIELMDGSVTTVDPYQVKFTDVMEIKNPKVS